MYIKSIVLDGFKTYGRRTEIYDFDREFNAITGLNGSGKSNILDAICFVLGITNLSHVRAQLLQDLIYKSGQAGITKASVSITFDNRDKKQSPVGYANDDEICITRQVVMGGRNKYLINGNNAQNKRVSDLFHTVQLNVNNPHFLVMQGRITKVLNMKPLEILSMIEEASGTSLFETKKQQAEKTLLRKDEKLHEIDLLLREDIEPRLNKLKEERVQYLDFQKVTRELEHLQKVFTAWQYTDYKRKEEHSNEKIAEIKRNIVAKKTSINDGQTRIKEIEGRIVELQQLKDSESGGRLNQIESDMREKEKNLTKHLGLQKQKKETIQDQNKLIKQLQKSITDEESLRGKKSASLANIESVFQKLAEDEEKDKLDLERAQHKFQALSSGLVADDEGGEATLQDQLMNAERSIAEAQSETSQCQLQKQHCEADLKKKQAEMQKTESEYRKDGKMLENLEKEVKNVEQQLSRLNHDETRLDALRSEQRQLTNSSRGLKNQVETLESRDPRLAFRYQDPEPNFNRKKVYGLVCKLIEVNDQIYSVALEKTAGGRLFNVVVDSEETGKKLINKGRLERRTTMIPLNKIQGRKLDARTVACAERIAGRNNIWPALSLISYDPKLEAAMQYVFGTTFICNDIDTAKRVCYHPEIMKRCVTLDGDTVDPSGTLSGGARQQTESVLTKLHQVKNVVKDLDEQENRLASIQPEINRLQANEQQYAALKQQFELKSHELNIVRQRLQQTTHYQYQEEVNSLKQKIEQLTAKQKECKEIIVTQSKMVKDIQDKMKNAKQNREKELKSAEADVKRLKKKSEQSRQEREKRTDEYDSLKLEVEELKKSIENNKTQIETYRVVIEKLEAEVQEMDDEVGVAKENVKTLQNELKALKDTINKKNKEITQFGQEKDKIIQSCREYELDIKQLEQDHERLQQDSKNCKRVVAEMLKKYDWIPQEEQCFGLPNGIYDFKENNPREMDARIKMLTDNREKLGRNINSKAMNLLNQTEEQYQELKKKRSQVEDDKQTIRAVIEDLDEKKKEALKQAWVQVNKDFGSIFSSLLPGAIAKLEPPQGKTVLDGLEFRVGFGNKFKESLGELSGGQRSLVALSLILAMLLFKPCPIYILDEVDAALDLSHTQNIGQMLKTHFKCSQFIIVSLKDGMFTNANVLFRTKLVDGMSTVTRYSQKQK